MSRASSASSGWLVNIEAAEMRFGKEKCNGMRGSRTRTPGDVNTLRSKETTMRAHENTATLPRFIPTTNSASVDRRVELIGRIGLGTLRYGLVLLLLMWGGAKFSAFEATAIQPLVANSPFLG